MTKKRSEAPGAGEGGELLPPVRRDGGARLASTRRVVLRRDGAELSGWVLNESRGGIRVVLEDPVEVGQEFELTIGADTAEVSQKQGRVVWVQEEKDGMVAGLEFTAEPVAKPVL